MLKNAGKAFLFGGCVCLVGQVLIMAFAFTPLYGMGYSTIAVLIALGLIGAIILLMGLAPKMDKFGGMGAMMPFTGLPPAIAQIFMGISRATGSKGKGFVGMLMEFFVKILIPIIGVCVILGTVYFFTGFGLEYTVPYAPAGVVVVAEGPPQGVPIGIDAISLLFAFLVGGAIMAIAQVIFQVTKLSVGIFFILLATLSTLLLPLGAMKALASFSGAGTMVTLFGAGEAIASTWIAFLMSITGVPGGTVVPFLLVLGLFVFLGALGTLVGAIRMAMDGDNPAGEAPPEGMEL